VTPDSPAVLLLDSSRRRERLTAESRQGLIVPREAVLPEEDGLSAVFPCSGSSVKTLVKAGAQ